ncbi:hypothetical protein HAX54_030206 [Datura stramonium]|uniref:Uncharacterized protein n=1 Tax=Datura stramonium TaxID=4076 RepID=A0ABS8V8L9_DATST|nr:hypothetical protein [Datura stramonium]
MEIFVNRKEEVATFEWLSQQGEGPKLYGCLPNGRVEEFIRGRTLFPHELRIPEISALVAAKVRKFHSLERSSGPKHVIIWDRLRSWLSNAKKLCCDEHIMEFSLDNLEEEINSLENELSNESQVIAFCHNDLHYGNMLFNETTQSLTLIVTNAKNDDSFDYMKHAKQRFEEYQLKRLKLFGSAENSSKLKDM